MSDAQSTRTTGNHAPLMAPESRMPFYEGMAFGLSYPTLVCRLKVRPGDQLSLSTLDRGMRGFIDPSSLIEAPGESGSGSVKALMERLNYWQAALQKSYNIPVFGDCHVRVKEEAPDSAGVFGALCAMPYAQVDASRAALQWVVAALNYFHHHPDEAGGKPEALEQALTAIEPALRRAGLQGTNALHFFEAAHLLNIPATRLNADICAVGTGIHSRWLASSITDRTGFLGVTLARSKFASAAILAQFGLPVPRHVRVRNEEEAVKAAETLAWPVVVKPEDRDQGEGVYPALGSEERVRFAFRESRRVAENILVEKHHPGEDYRLTVLEGRVVKVMHRRPATAYGDGTKTVIQLAEDLQQERRFQEAYRRTGKKRIELDAEALGLLEEQGLTPDSVPDSGMAVRLRGKSNISSGGSHELVPLEAIHPDNRALAIRTARLLNLDLAGIDLIIPDIGVPWHSNGGVLCEVNAQPQIGYRDMPELYQRILRQLVGPEAEIPLHLIVTREPPDEEVLRTLLEQAPRLGCNGVSADRGVFIDGEQCVWHPRNAFVAARSMIFDNAVKGGLVLMSAADVRRFGLPVPRFRSVRVEQTGAAIGGGADQEERYLMDQLQRHADQVAGFALTHSANQRQG